MSAEYRKLEEVCEILDSMRVPITAKDRKSGIYPYYGANGLQDYVADYIFDDELILLAEDGGNFGSKERPIAYRVSGKCWVNNHAHVLKAKPIINVDYLCYALMFYDTEGLVNGATRQKLTQSAMRQMVIPYRSMAEQMKIVEEISKVIRLIDKHKEELLLLDQLVKSRFIEMFGDPMLNPKGFPVKTIEKVSKLNKGITYAPEEVADEGIIVLRSSNIKGCEFDLQDLVKITKKILPDKFVQENDILMCNRNGSARLVGKVALIPKLDENMTFGTFMTIVRSDIYDYLFTFFQLKAFREQIRFQTAVTINQISLPILASVKLPIPPRELIDEFSLFKKQTDKSKYCILIALTILGFMRKIINRRFEYDKL